MESCVFFSLGKERDVLFVKGKRFFVNLDGIEATEGADDPNWREGASNPNREVVAEIEPPTPRNQENPQIGDSPNFDGWSHDPAPSTGVVNALPPIGVGYTSVASIPSKLTKNLQLF
ncbi:hypothetical protein CRG98_018223 [Punica granatum]|uniref:Uncharacterized protein n=1 Tax=Punica granatum TaxID=22663 RepID=A0A2I0JYJ9_PUNGR|nr:hypothetical protein CRG98_018223 [Punica granatum]